MLIFLYFGGLRVKKGQKRPKMAITFCLFVWGYGVCKMTARACIVFLDIRTRRQNAFFFLFWGVVGSKEGRKGSKITKKKFFVYETWGCLIDR